MTERAEAYDKLVLTINYTSKFLYCSFNIYFYSLYMPTGAFQVHSRLHNLYIKRYVFCETIYGINIPTQFQLVQGNTFFPRCDVALNVTPGPAGLCI